MKVTDLMVGDWVYIHEPECKGHRIDAIDELDGQVGADGEVYDECDIRPIPLTEDILAKNFGGYDHIDYDKEARIPCYFVGNRRVFVDSIMDKGHCFYFCHEDDWAGLHDIEIHYVHQLQHLLRLCGIEKEIEL